MLSSLLFVVAVPVFIFSFLCSGSDTLLQGQSLFPNQTLVSKGGKFELGFFSPDSSNNYYIGIWYKNIPVKTVVWVLNRASPIPYSSYNDSRIQLWFGGLLIRPIDASWEEGGSSNISEAVILDTGNFVLRTGSGVDLWQSFDYPTDTWLPGMKLNGREMLYYDNNNNNYHYYRGLLSWMNPNDPSPGNYSLHPGGIDNEVSTLILINRSEILWRSGALQGGGFSSLHDYSAFSTSYNFSYFPSSSSTADYDGYIVYNVYNESLLSRIVIDYLGRLMHYGWSEARQAWVVLSCSAHPSCRPNTICDVSSCKCLDAFVPRVQQDWDSSVFFDGCKRMRPLDCTEGKIKFINVTTARLPANSQSRKFTNDVCNLACSGDCSCTAYYYAHDHGDCLLFMGDLSSLVGPSNISVGVDLHLKQESTHHTAPTTAKLLVIILPIASVLLISCCCFFYMWPKLKNKEYEVTHQDLLRFHLNPNERQGSVGKSDPEEKTSQYELPIFSFSSIAASTNNFSIANKLGQGGFGPVYKGELLNGQFVAVKRLSMRSGQGLEEFSNETKLIAKLQHRNLVEILGCCNENDEMILVYEYMPNQSLDIFLFEPTKKEVLDWKRRVRIIEGIAQGLLYLHHHSRLKIVHRDLKASNILLDAEMNPKISDFGMARIFGGNELQENTKRIVGTYGYMSPEYAMEGLFSVKSDMFAFGVLMLEIITGKKNVGFYGSDSLSLLRYAWDLWKNDSAHELIDPMLEISDSSSSILALRYIQISLLCVEENPAERPLISDVVGMLNNEKKPIGSPKNPAFTVGRSLVKATPAQHRVEICSVNDLTLSNVEAR